MKKRDSLKWHPVTLPCYTFEDGIEVISVGTSFLRFLEIASIIDKPVCVVTDNDGDVVAVHKKYEKYLGENKKVNIDICFDPEVDEAKPTIKGNKYNYNTLEPNLFKVNGLSTLNAVFGTSYTSDDDLLIHMKENKTDCALKLFNYKNTNTIKICYPQYILNAIK